MGAGFILDDENVKRGGLANTRLRRIGFGISVCPFWWQWGDVSYAHGPGRMLACGPFRFAWRFQ